MMMMMMMKTYDRDVDVSHDQQNQHNQPVTLRSPQHLWRHWRCQTDLRFTLRFQTFLHTFLTFLFASVKKRKIPAVFCLEVEGLFHMYYIIYIICHPFFFWNLECLKKKCEDFFFRAMLLSSLISFPTDPSQLVRCFLVIPWHETMEIFKVSPVKMKTSVVVFFKRVKQWLIIYWTNVCFFFQGEKNELKV